MADHAPPGTEKKPGILENVSTVTPGVREKGTERLMVLDWVQSTQNKSHGMFYHLSRFLKSRLTPFIKSYHDYSEITS